MLDFDGVIGEIFDIILPWWNAVHGTSYVFEDIKDWDLDKTFGPDANKKIFEYMNTPDFYDHVKPQDDCISVIQNLINEGHDVIIVTAIPKTCPNTYGGKLKWITRHLPFFDLQNFYTGKRKENIYAHLQLDDGPHNLEAFPGVTVAYDRPWNKSVYTAYRVKTWFEFYTIIQELTLKKS
jgi:5'(3')-deoxyribonucleotidase